MEERGLKEEVDRKVKVAGKVQPDANVKTDDHDVKAEDIKANTDVDMEDVQIKTAGRSLKDEDGQARVASRKRKMDLRDTEGNVAKRNDAAMDDAMAVDEAAAEMNPENDSMATTTNEEPWDEDLAMNQDPDSHISFEDGKKYWEGIDATVDGMLGGFESISRIDIQGSKNFLAKLGIGEKAGKRKLSTVLEGGAGIGRVTQGLLVKIAETVDIIEPIKKFSDEQKGKPGLGVIFNIGMQDWQPAPTAPGAEPKYYDLVWNQLCLGHLTDDQLVEYLKRCQTALCPQSGLIVVKENVTRKPYDQFDDLDSSVTRQDSKFAEIFKKAGLRLVRSEYQKALPKVIFPIKMYALKPVVNST